MSKFGVCLPSRVDSAAVRCVCVHAFVYVKCVCAFVRTAVTQQFLIVPGRGVIGLTSNLL